jgi:uncharacterized protein (TIGR00251 family)
MLLKIKVKPNSSKSEFDEKNSLAYLKSPPQDNKANMELIKLLAKHFHVSSSQVKIKKGLTNKEKTIEIKN